MLYPHLAARDPNLHGAVLSEFDRRNTSLEMIPSENVTSVAVLEALGSILTDKYSEGYPGKRYYGGNEHIDTIETLARERAKSLFGVSHANVQPYSGSPANQAVYHALLDAGDTVMGMSLAFGGHLTHGHSVNFSGKFFHSVAYTTDANGFLDYDAIAALAAEHKPKLLICGATAYPRLIDFARMAAIAKSVDAFLLADISHIAGLVVAGVHPSPVGHADVVTTTTHKTLRGPRGAIILCNGNESTPLKAVERTRENLPTLIDRAVFPGLQGGPHNHQTAAIAVALRDAATPEFKSYGEAIVKNAKKLASELMARGWKLSTEGTDNHLLLIDVTPLGLTGGEAERALGAVGITVNKNTIPHDTRKPFDPSGIRCGTPSLTTRGFDEADMVVIAEIMHDALIHANDQDHLVQLRNRVAEIARAHPPYPELMNV